MGLQAQLNEHSIRKVPKTYALIRKLEGQDRDNLISLTLRAMMDSYTPVAEMTAKELEEFDSSLAATNETDYLAKHCW